ncbi:hypothetical protein CKAH01_02822 [Colletotrichum kahawae]|uniref:Uncharacterized protein n=1 Tax=Colletotrichum kahawae TaxID=34407 RepID=A0AAD9XWL6_COLKA|nr:hypothetical protein CKAH01_02822 [Colletotrichum kahawae]
MRILASPSRSKIVSLTTAAAGLLPPRMACSGRVSRWQEHRIQTVLFANCPECYFAKRLQILARWSHASCPVVCRCWNSASAQGDLPGRIRTSISHGA